MSRKRKRGQCKRNRDKTRIKTDIESATIGETAVTITCANLVDSLLPPLGGKGKKPAKSPRENPHDPNIVPDKFWAQRYRLFRKFDHGIRLDGESWYSVTPQAIAEHLAFRTGGDCGVILDLFCGCGGNAIAFAKLAGAGRVVCVDCDLEKLRMAARNASIYGVDPAKIVFCLADATDVLSNYWYGYNREKVVDEEPVTLSDESVWGEACEGYRIGGFDLLPEMISPGLVFMSPPWGGCDYTNVGEEGFDLARDIAVSHVDVTPSMKQGAADDDGAPVNNSQTKSVNGVELLHMASKATMGGKVVYFLPRNINPASIGRAAPEDCVSIEFEDNRLNGKLKTVTAYYDINY